MVRNAALALGASALLIATGCVTTTSATIRADGSEGSSVTITTVEDFYPVLAPYGEWIWVPGLGRVWRPYDYVVGFDFVPYSTGGRWVYTEAGWTFVSNFDWGWATFHYGHWVRLHRGWVWVPGTTWAPAWVEWRYGGGYVGWAPLPPPGYRVAYVTPVWTYVETRYFVEPEVHRYRIPPSRYHEATAVTQPAPTYSPGAMHVAGPPPSLISRETGRSFTAAPRPPPGEAVPRPPAGESGASASVAGPSPRPLAGPQPPGAMSRSWVANAGANPTRALPTPPPRSTDEPQPNHPSEFAPPRRAFHRPLASPEPPQTRARPYEMLPREVEQPPPATRSSPRNRVRQQDSDSDSSHSSLRAPPRPMVPVSPVQAPRRHR